MTDRINARAEFERLAAQAPTHTLRSDAGRVFDVGAAWDAYEDNPDRFHRITADNPEGDPISALILSDGPWWVRGEGGGVTRKRTAARIDHYVLRRAMGGCLDVNLPDDRTDRAEIRQAIRRLADAGLIHVELFRHLNLRHLTVPADRRDEVELRLALIDADAAHGYGQARYALTGRQHGPDALEVADAIYAPLGELGLRRCGTCDGSGRLTQHVAMTGGGSAELDSDCPECGTAYLAGWVPA